MTTNITIAAADSVVDSETNTNLESPTEWGADDIRRALEDSELISLYTEQLLDDFYSSEHYVDCDDEPSVISIGETWPWSGESSERVLGMLRRYVLSDGEDADANFGMIWHWTGETSKRLSEKMRQALTTTESSQS